MKLGVMRRPSPSHPHIDQARPDLSSGFALFNKRIEVIDQSVSVQPTIDVENRIGPLGLCRSSPRSPTSPSLWWVMVEQLPTKWFAGLSSQNKTIVLSKIVYEFTILIRMLPLSPLDATGVRKIQGVGELTHRIVPYLIALNSGDKERFADEELIALFTAADDYELGQRFNGPGALSRR
ncbi:hypothetical protein RZS28_06455 [Methylocapsa polymorpha]|uniref:Uncharacterized protein n=1 Tax=Methylocapsa polymorpha TaxID=3080828 RepID=A0ABZ0HUG8_9HYPH|nr:hypothetical protein RZS28_06455 [Methylocapsa sp. RX1]